MSDTLVGRVREIESLSKRIAKMREKPPQACTSGEDRLKVRFVSWQKRILFVAIGAFVWLLAPSALAAAPQCDVRAATTVAPPPTLEDLASSIDLGDSCAPSAPLDFVHQGRGSSELGFSASPDVALSSDRIVVSSPRSAVLPRGHETSTAPPGVKSSIDRPPRA